MPQRSIAAAETATFGRFGGNRDSAAAPTVSFAIQRPKSTGLTFSTPTYSLDTTEGGLYIGTTGAGAIQINATSGGVATKDMTLMIDNDAGGARTVTFGTNFRPTATLVGTANKRMCIQFMSDGTNWIETGRTIAIT